MITYFIACIVAIEYRMIGQSTEVIAKNYIRCVLTHKIIFVSYSGK
jgi:hypothetical protein